ncbi:hypothetical protein Q3G72_033522 [Acer saccharum]|nr:hypothetical protein Q3G72_033522 [Acer saccharum]
MRAKDVCQDSLDKEVDPNHQECLSENPTYVDFLAKVKCLEENLKIALREVNEKDDLIKLQVDEFVSTTRRPLGEKNALAKKLREVEEIILEKDRIISSLTLGGLSHIKPKCFKYIEYCKVGNASRDKEIELHFKHAKAFEYGKHDNVTKHVKNVRNVKNANLAKIDKSCVASNVEKKSINDILVEQVIEGLYYRFNIVVNKNLDNVCVGSPKTKFVKGIVNETMVREFYHEYKESTSFEDALLDLRGVVFRVNSKNLNKFLELPYDIESDFLDVDVLENLNEMGRTLCDNDDFEWGKRAFIRLVS